METEIEPPDVKEDDVVAEQQALELWLSAKPLAGTIAESYLREHRGITMPLPRRVLKYHPRPQAGWPVPALIAAVEGLDGRVTAVQSTFLDPDTGTKADVRAVRKVFGRLHSGAVRLHPPDENGLLGLAEGIETALSVFELTKIPCWAVLGAHRLARIALPPDVREVRLFRDNDLAGESAATAAANVYFSEGFRVFVCSPGDPAHKDFNDLLRSGMCP